MGQVANLPFLADWQSALVRRVRERHTACAYYYGRHVDCVAYKGTSS
jgi:hypothetical protein